MKKIIRKIISLFYHKNNAVSVFTKDNLGETIYEIGDFTYGIPVVMHFGENTKFIVGRYCSIAQNVKIFIGGNHRVDWVSTYPFQSFSKYFPNASGVTGHPSSNGDVVIGNDVWIGFGTIILSGVIISNGAVIAAASVVTKNIGPYEIWGGNPAKFIRKRFTDDQINCLEKISWWNWEVEKVNEQVKGLSSHNVDDFIKVNR